jgi:hypothetical protein
MTLTLKKLLNAWSGLKLSNQILSFNARLSAGAKYFANERIIVCKILDFMLLKQNKFQKISEYTK